MTFHLRELVAAGLVSQARAGRSNARRSREVADKILERLKRQLPLEAAASAA